ncbi:uncharacterized protein LOC144147074 isoform X2 [Haemaphysalis longicornis]
MATQPGDRDASTPRAVPETAGVTAGALDISTTQEDMGVSPGQSSAPEGCHDSIQIKEEPIDIVVHDDAVPPSVGMDFLDAVQVKREAADIVVHLLPEEFQEDAALPILAGSSNASMDSNDPSSPSDRLPPHLCDTDDKWLEGHPFPCFSKELQPLLNGERMAKEEHRRLSVHLRREIINFLDDHHLIMDRSHAVRRWKYHYLGKTLKARHGGSPGWLKLGGTGARGSSRGSGSPAALPPRARTRARSPACRVTKKSPPKVHWG